MIRIILSSQSGIGLDRLRDDVRICKVFIRHKYFSEMTLLTLMSSPLQCSNSSDFGLFCYPVICHVWPSLFNFLLTSLLSLILTVGPVAWDLVKWLWFPFHLPPIPRKSDLIKVLYEALKVKSTAGPGIHLGAWLPLPNLSGTLKLFCPLGILFPPPPCP